MDEARERTVASGIRLRSREFLGGLRQFPRLLRTAELRTLIPASFVLSLSVGLASIAMSWVAASQASMLPGSVLLAACLTGSVTATMVGAWLVKLGSQRLNGRTLVIVDLVWRGLFWLLGGGLLARMEAFNDYAFIAVTTAAAVTISWSRSGIATMITQSVPSSQRLEANGWMSSQAALASLAGPAVGGLLTASLGGLWTLQWAGGTLLLTAAILAWATRQGDLPGPAGASTDQYSVAHIIKVTPFLLPLLITTCAMAFFFGFLQVALPLLAAGTSSSLGGATYLGSLWAGFGLGCLVGSFLSPVHRGLSIWVSAFVTCIAWGGTVIGVALFSATPTLGILFMVAAGLFYAPYSAVSATYLQNSVPPGSVAAVVAFWAACVTVAQPVGIAFAGVLSSVIAVASVAVISGAGSILVGVFAFLLRRYARGIGQPSLSAGPDL